MKKIISIALLSGLMLFSLAGCGSDNKNEASTGETVEAAHAWEATVQGDGSWDRVEKAGKILAGLDDSYPPMGYRDAETDEIIGFDIDMANAIGEKIGVPFEFVPADWNAIVPSLTTGKFDCIISGMNMWDDRISEVNFVPYGVAGQLVLVKADREDIDDIKSLDYFKDKKIGTQLGSTAAKYLQNEGFDDSNLALYKTYPEITIDLENGRIDALVIDSFGAAELINSGKYVDVLNIAEGRGDSTHGEMANAIGIAIRKDDGDLQLKIQQAVDELLVDGTLSELSMKWIGSDITADLIPDAEERLNQTA